MKISAFVGTLLGVALLVVSDGSLSAGGISNSGAVMGDKRAKILFLHHSTGKSIARGGAFRLLYKITGNGDLNGWLANNTNYDLAKRIFPTKEGYGWNNYPYDYYNIWVQHGGQQPYKGQPTLEMLSPAHDVIMFKHCFPVSHIEPDDGQADASSAKRTLANYKLQYMALKEKMHQYPDTRFILWTGAALTKAETSEADARRMKAFVDWVRNDWDEAGDNVFLWDFYSLETDGGLYLKDEYAVSPNNSHPNWRFSRRVAPLLGQRIVDVVEGRGDSAPTTGKSKVVALR